MRDPEEREQDRADQHETSQEQVAAVPRGSRVTHALVPILAGNRAHGPPETRTRRGSESENGVVPFALRVIRTLGRSLWGTNARPLASAAHGVARQGERLLEASVEKSSSHNKDPMNRTTAVLATTLALAGVAYAGDVNV